MSQKPPNSNDKNNKLGPQRNTGGPVNNVRKLSESLPVNDVPTHKRTAASVDLDSTYVPPNTRIAGSTVVLPTDPALFNQAVKLPPETPTTKVYKSAPPDTKLNVNVMNRPVNDDSVIITSQTAGKGFTPPHNETVDSVTVYNTNKDFYFTSIESNSNQQYFNNEASGFSGYSGVGLSGYSGQGLSGFSGQMGASGWSGFSGNPGAQGLSGISGYSGVGLSGVSGYSGLGQSGYSGAGLNPWTLITSNFYAENNDRLIADTSGGSFTVYLPSTPVTGDYIQITDGWDFAINPCFVDPNGGTIENLPDIVALDIKGVTFEFIYNSPTWEVTATTGARGQSGYSGTQGAAGTSGYSGVGLSGYSGETGKSGYSGEQGISGQSGQSGYSGNIGATGLSGYSGTIGQQGVSGFSGSTGTSGYSGDPGQQGISGFSGQSGTQGTAGQSGASGYSGVSGVSGFSGVSGYSGVGGPGASGFSGTSGQIGVSGFSGISGITGSSGYSGNQGSSGFSGISGFSGTTGSSGISGYSGQGLSGFSGISGYSGMLGNSGASGVSGYSGVSGISGNSGYSGSTGISGFSGFSGQTGSSGQSGFSGTSGWSGISGISGSSGYSGVIGTSGFSGSIGASGWSGVSGFSGATGNAGTQGTSGYSGISGISGLSGLSGYSGIGLSGYSGSIGISGESGYSGQMGTSGWSGISGIQGSSGYSGSIGNTGSSGYSGYSGEIGQSGYSGSIGSSGFSGNQGISGFSGLAGQSGVSGYSGAQGISGYSSFSGYSGVSGHSGASGFSGISGESGISGFSGISGYSGQGLSGFSGISGYSGVTGLPGDSGVSGYSGISGYSGTPGISGYSGVDGVSGYSGVSGFSGTSGYSGTTGASGYSGTTNVFLGTPTTGDYSSGLFPWVANVTLLADAEQSVNNVLSALAPSPAPVYSQFSITNTGVVGKLTYGASNPLGGVTSVAGIGSAAPVSTSVDTDGTYTPSGMRKGIFGTATTSWTGILNSQVATGPGTPNPAYVQYAFLCENGSQGIVNIYVNDDTTPKHSVNLDTFASGTSVNANGTGLTSVSVLTSELFPNGTAFTLFQYRTANLVVNSADCRDGWNWVRVTQVVGATSRPLVNFYGDFVRDNNTTATTFSSESMNSFAGTGSKYLSGVQYYTGGSAVYTTTINNLYRNTYYSASDAITYANNSTPLQAISNDALGNSGGNQALAVTPSKTVNITATGVRLNPAAGSTITVRTTARRTVQTSITSTGASVTNILLDNVAASSTITLEDFNDEVYRLPSNSNFDLSGTGVTGAWASSNSVANAGSAGYNDGLQTYNGTLVIPSINFSTISNGPAGNVNYSTGVTGQRTYYRFFSMATARSNFTITVTGTATPRAYSYSMTTGTNDIKIAIKLPNSGGEGTGWMDVTALFATNAWTDGSGCLLSGSFAMNAARSITVGTKSTGSPSVNGIVFLRITVPQAWTGNLNTITLVGA